MSNVVCAIAPPEDLWMQFEHKVRKNVKKARTSGVRTVVADPLTAVEDFLNIYNETMQRRAASDQFLLGREQVELLVDELKQQLVISVAYVGAEPVSTEMVLTTSSEMYSFLGGTKSDAFPMRPNDLVKFDLIEWAHQRDIRNFVLGGGVAQSDGIFRYKRSFAPYGVVDFQIGELVVDPERYSVLERRRALQLGHEPSGFTPAYRSS